MTLYQQGIARYGGESSDILYSPLKYALMKHTANTGKSMSDVARIIGIHPGSLKNILYHAKYPHKYERGARVSKALAYALAEYLGITLSSFTLDVNERRPWTRRG